MAFTSYPRGSRPWVRSACVAALVALTALLATPTGASAGQAGGTEGIRRFKAVTYNLYLGADLAPILQAGSLVEALVAVKQAWADVQATNFPERAEAIADQIAALNPKIVALQEVSIYRSGPHEDAPATTLEYEFLTTLRNALAARGLTYDPVAVSKNLDVEFPSGYPPEEDVRLTDRDVLLIRKPLHAWEIVRSRHGHFDTTLEVSVGPYTLPVTRGWAAIDATIRGKPVRIVDAHLEAFDDTIQEGQAAELLAGPLDTGKPTLLLGDLNSPADGTGSSSYQDMIDAGFIDVWDEGTLGNGFTCCQAADLLNATSTLDERIDVILGRGAWDSPWAQVLGEEDADKTTPTGMWPSDHAGVGARVVLAV